MRGGVYQEAYAKVLSTSGRRRDQAVARARDRQRQFPDARSTWTGASTASGTASAPRTTARSGRSGRQVDTDEPDARCEDDPPEGGAVPDLNPAPPLDAPTWTRRT